MELTALKGELIDCCTEAIQTLFQEEEGFDREQYRTWLSRMESMNCDYLVAESYAQESRWAEMENVLEAISGKYEVSVEQQTHFASCMQFRDRWANEETNEDQWEADMDYLWTVAAGDWGYTSDLAKSILKSLDMDFDAPHNPDFPELLESDERCVWLTSLMYSTSSSQNTDEAKIQIPEPQNQDFQRTESPLASSSSQPVEKEMKKTEITLNPNPTHGELRIESEELKMIEIQIFDIVGRVAMQFPMINSSQTMLNVEHLDNGLYFIKVFTENGEQKTKKFVKR